MKRILYFALCFTAISGFVIAQRPRVTATDPIATRMEMMSVFPREITPGRYQQVDQVQLAQIADQGWELVSVMPYVYRNEERGPEFQGPKPVVTQTYPAYFFKRTKSVVTHTTTVVP